MSARKALDLDRVGARRPGRAGRRAPSRGGGRTSDTRAPARDRDTRRVIGRLCKAQFLSGDTCSFMGRS